MLAVAYISAYLQSLASAMLLAAAAAGQRRAATCALARYLSPLDAGLFASECHALLPF